MSFLGPRTASERWIHAAWEKRVRSKTSAWGFRITFWDNWGGAGQESSFDWSSAEGMNRCPSEKEAALAAAAEGTLQEGYLPRHPGGTGEVRSQHRDGGSSRDVAGDLNVCQSFPCGKYLVDMIY